MPMVMLSVKREDDDVQNGWYIGHAIDEIHALYHVINEKIW